MSSFSRRRRRRRPRPALIENALLSMNDARLKIGRRRWLLPVIERFVDLFTGHFPMRRLIRNKPPVLSCGVAYGLFILFYTFFFCNALVGRTARFNNCFPERLSRCSGADRRPAVACSGLSARLSHAMRSSGFRCFLFCGTRNANLLNRFSRAQIRQLVFSCRMLTEKKKKRYHFRKSRSSRTSFIFYGRNLSRVSVFT